MSVSCMVDEHACLERLSHGQFYACVVCSLPTYNLGVDIIKVVNSNSPVKMRKVNSTSQRFKTLRSEGEHFGKVVEVS